jgi:hypothetical protein
LRENETDFTSRDHPYPDNNLSPPKPERSVTGQEFPDDGCDYQEPTNHQDSLVAGLNRIEDPDINGCANRHKEHGHKEMTKMGRAMLDFPCLRRSGNQKSGCEGPDD